MRNKLSFILVWIIFFSAVRITFAQTLYEDSLKNVTTIGKFEGIKVNTGNFDTAKVYMINDYYIAVNYISTNLSDSLKGKTVRVTGKLNIAEGKLFPARISNNDTIYEPYKDHDKKFITNPVFKIIP